MGWLSDLFDPGKKDRDKAGKAAEQARFNRLSATGPFGLSSLFQTLPGGQTQSSYSLGEFAPLAQLLMQQAGVGFGGLAGGMAGIAGLGDQTMDFLGGQTGPNSITNGAQAGGLAQLFASALPTATADPFALGQQTTDILRQGATKSNQNLVNQTFDRLFQRGGLSNQAVREQVTDQVSQQLDQQDLGFQLSGLEQGRNLQNDALGRLFGAFSGLEGNASRLFGEGMSTADLLRQNALSRFGVGQSVLNMNSGLSQMLLGNLTGLTSLPLQFQQAALNAQGVKSNADLGVASVHQNNASMAKSPLLEAFNAVGSFAGSLGGFDLGSLFGKVGGGAPAGGFQPTQIGFGGPSYNQYGSTLGFGNYNPLQVNY